MRGTLFRDDNFSPTVQRLMILSFVELDFEECRFQDQASANALRSLLASSRSSLTNIAITECEFLFHGGNACALSENVSP